MSERAVELKDQGNAALKNGDPAGAASLYTEAIGLDPTNHILFSNRSCVRLKLGDSSGALEDAVECIDLQPTFSKGFIRAASASEALGQLGDACRYLQRGLSVDPTNMPLTKKLAAASVKMEVSASEEEGHSSVQRWEAELANESLPEQERANAAISLGSVYIRGQFGKAKDPEKSIHFFRKSAELGHLIGMSNTGALLLEAGKREEGLKWLTKAAEQGNCMAAMQLANDAEMAGDGEAALKWLCEVAETHNEGEAFARAGSHLFNLKQYQEAAKYYLRGVKAGDHGFNCAMNLATMYFGGQGVTRNAAEALRLYQKVVSKALGEQNEYAWAKSMIGQHKVLSAMGKVAEARQLVPTVLPRLGEWKKLDPVGCCRDVAEMYVRETVSGLQSVPGMADTAEAWARSGAGLGNAYCMLMFAQLLGMKGKFEEAMEQLRASAEGGEPVASFTLGTRYATGSWGVEINFERAVQFFLQAAKQGYVLAMCALAKCYMCGLGTTKDDDQASFWTEKAGGKEVVFKQCSTKSGTEPDGNMFLLSGTPRSSHTPIADDLIANGADVTGLQYACHTIGSTEAGPCTYVTFEGLKQQFPVKTTALTPGAA
jgi:TPR repeat protein